MGLQQISADDVRRAAELYDELGSTGFLSRYGFHAARDYVLVIDGRNYPSKAILGVGHEFASGRALASREFSGGRQQTVPVLEKLGFTIRSTGAAEDDSDAYMLLWNPKQYEWPDQDRLAILDATLHGHREVERWSIFANSTKVKDGDRIFMRKTGDHPRGIIASGQVVGTPFKDGHWGDEAKKPAIYIEVIWDAMVEPNDVFDLLGVAERYPSATWTAPGGGARIPAEARGTLEQEWASHVETTVGTYTSSPTGAPSHADEIERGYGLALVKVRRHQKAFRDLLLHELPPICEYEGCGITSLAILEAAHIKPDSEGGEPVFENGLLLCRNHHRAMDAGLMRYDGEGGFDWAEGIEQF